MDNIKQILNTILGNNLPKSPDRGPSTSVPQRSPAYKGNIPVQASWLDKGAAPASSTNEFKYQMGQDDYSNLKPQIEAILKGTPLEPYMNNFIQAGNQNGIDPRVLLTIANNESSLGKNYPTDSNNPFGYLVGGGGVQGLKNAGFTSVPMAIERLTGRFKRQPTQGYKDFYNNPTVQNLQTAYNANPAEQDTYIRNALNLIGRMQ